MLKFSPANAKLKRLNNVSSLKPYLKGKRKVYSFDSGLSGHSCPFAQDCLSKVKIVDGKRKLFDGPQTQFRCFSASQEVLFTGVYNKRKKHGEILQKSVNKWDMAAKIVEALPNDAGIVRWNVAGDIFSQEYFDALIIVANSVPSVLFYAYTKSLPYWVKRLGQIPDNFVLTASHGGRRDNMIDEYGLRSARVVFSEVEAKEKNLVIDHDDSHAANPLTRNNDFALLIHGVQPKGSEASKAVKKLNGKGSYSS